MFDITPEKRLQTVCELANCRATLEGSDVILHSKRMYNYNQLRRLWMCRAVVCLGT